MQKIVITGGPGIGKTTVIEILASRGCAIVPEGARIIIEQEKIKGSDLLPWKDRTKFHQAVFDKQLELEAKAMGERVFLDRGFADVVGYCRYYNIAIPAGMDTAAKNRYDKVFILEPLDHYELDEVREESIDVAKQVHLSIARAYEEMGYKLVVVPILPPQERADFILARV